jgi:chromatin segregation and condensation protein Rec8/ScpA/Scc1 (kleisin family)
MDTETETMIETPPKALGLAEISANLEAARRTRSDAQAAYEAAGEAVKAAVIAEREAYKAFNEAVDAMKPKRQPRAPKATADNVTPITTDKPKKVANKK